MTWLTLALAFLAIASWMSTFLLVRAALIHPRIGALSERAVLQVLLTAFGTLCAVLLWNRDANFLPVEVGRALFTGVSIALLCASPLWLLLFISNRLGGDR